MSEIPYQNREIDQHMREIRNMFKEHAEDDKQNFSFIRESIDGLTEQVKKTNGTVKGLQLWRSYMLGGISVLSILFVPILLKVLGL